MKCKTINEWNELVESFIALEKVGFVMNWELLPTLHPNFNHLSYEEFKDLFPD